MTVILAFAEEGDVHVVVETPRGSRAKFAFDPKLEAFTLKKPLPGRAELSARLGFAPSTQSEDDDPLDIMVALAKLLMTAKVGSSPDPAQRPKAAPLRRARCGLPEPRRNGHGGRYRDRTCGPSRVKGVLYR